MRSDEVSGVANIGIPLPSATSIKTPGVSNPLVTTIASIGEFLRKLSGYSQHIMIDDLLIESLRSGGKQLVCRMTVTIYLIEEKELLTDA